MSIYHVTQYTDSFLKTFVTSHYNQEAVPDSKEEMFLPEKKGRKTIKSISLPNSQTTVHFCHIQS